MSDLGSELGSDFGTELRRVVDRLRGMPVGRLAACEEPTHATMAAIAGTTVPRIGAHALGDQLQVVVDEAARDPRFDPDAAAAALAVLRRSLP